MSTKKPMTYVGFCRICGTGPLGLRECGGCNAVVVLCDECDATWTDADFSSKPRFAQAGRLPCPHCEASLIEKPSRWATKTKINGVAWVQAALREGKLQLKQGSALAPEIDDPN